MACKTKKCTTAKTKKTTPSTEFAITAPDAKEVFLVGEFNDWNGDGFRMRRYKNGVFKKKPNSNRDAMSTDLWWMVSGGRTLPIRKSAQTLLVRKIP